MQTTATLKYFRTAPRKVRLLVDMVRGKKVEDALVQLQFSKKSAAKPVRKLIESAVANAIHNHKMDKESLVISSAFVNEGPTQKRWQPRAFGRAFVIRKRTSHITIVLTGEVKEPVLEEKKKTTTEKKVETKKTSTTAKKAKVEKEETTKK
ncbi:MAG: 50S ribosomal protein L22 [Candidatus Magasanikbacteria bacterium]|nr:50S ribosomal protein L22 [Candidatus Magasanikbacteria bacterium]MBT4071381.1 50S ribosomal protein L22 [Candidatus Magasanikbacteria bacterium]